MGIREYPGLITGVKAILPGDHSRQRAEERREQDCGLPLGLTLSPSEKDDPGSPPALFTWKLRLPFCAIGKPRMTRRDKWAKRPAVMAYRDWADSVREHLKDNPLPPADKILSLDWIATFPPPESWSKKKKQACIGTPHRTKPDRDNCDKAILDILYPGCDQQIPKGTISKVWGLEPSLEIVILSEP